MLSTLLQANHQKIAITLEKTTCRVQTVTWLLTSSFSSGEDADASGVTETADDEEERDVDGDAKEVVCSDTEEEDVVDEGTAEVEAEDALDGEVWHGVLSCLALRSSSISFNTLLWALSERKTSHIVDKSWCCLHKNSSNLNLNLLQLLFIHLY